ncbi:metallophosphoesterase [Desulfopila sp. IMCC35008]|uniref:metallophosphoesterase family protein n=1 Tax=Desulfopila sp. IMCC35008 TaxID=2653858 RepID=UPI0013D58854|nr:YfcE family phosphodiesterase [Desulfopila sp. IMCC35008]
MTRIGILSDTHISSVTNSFQQNVQSAFHDCEVIIHAGDLTEVSILSAFKGKEVYAVCGNMCTHITRKSLPESTLITIDGYLFGLCHGAGGARHNIEDRMYSMFPEAHCIVYGHTHIPVCHTVGSTLIINPGSFTSTGRYGSPGTYSIVTVDEDGIQGAVHQLDSGF